MESFFTEVAVEAPPTFDGVMLYHDGIPPIHLENTLPPRCGSESLGICHWFSPPFHTSRSRGRLNLEAIHKEIHQNTVGKPWKHDTYEGKKEMMQPRGTP